MKFCIILILSIIAVCYANDEPYVEKSSIRQIFDRHIYGISLLLGMGMLHECHNSDLSDTAKQNIEAEAIAYDACYKAGIEEIITKYEPTTIHLNSSSFENSDFYPPIVCEFYNRTHTCALDIIPTVLPCVVPSDDTNKYNLMYQGVKYGLDIACENDGEILKMLMQNKDQFNCYAEVVSKEKLLKLVESNEKILFSTEASCLYLLDVSVTIQEISQWRCVSFIAKTMKRIALKVWENSGCNTLVNVSEIFNNRL